MYKKIIISNEKHEENLNKFKEFLDVMNVDLRNKIINKLLIDNQKDYFTDPASGLIRYHNCCVGGLLDHSVGVTEEFLKRVERDSLEPEKYSKEYLIFCGLFHDLGKTGDERNKYYIPQLSNWHQKNKGEYWKYNDEIRFMTVGQRSLYLIQRAGIQLEFDYYEAILLHDGCSIETNRIYMFKETELAVLLHHADYITAIKEKEKGKI